MALYMIQDPDRPMYVMAGSMGDAVKKWQQFVALEDGLEFDDVEEPNGVSFLVEDYDCILE